MQQANHLYPQIFRDLLVNEVKRRLFEESLPRILSCLSMLDEDDIWYQANEHTNSVGVLVLHVCGNARQWICSGLGGLPDLRRRGEEFKPGKRLTSVMLTEVLHDMRTDVEAVLDSLPAEALLQAISIQGFEENGISVLVHVTEHFSYHVGQITQAVKMLKNRDTGYYTGMKLD